LVGWDGIDTIAVLRYKQFEHGAQACEIDSHDNSKNAAA